MSWGLTDRKHSPRDLTSNGAAYVPAQASVVPATTVEIHAPAKECKHSSEVPQCTCAPCHSAVKPLALHRAAPATYRAALTPLPLPYLSVCHRPGHPAERSLSRPTYRCCCCRVPCCGGG